MADEEIIGIPETLFRKRPILAAYEIVRVLNNNQFRLYYNGSYYIYLDIGESDTMLSRAIGFFERHKFNLIQRLLRPGDVFLDIGGNKGDFSLFAASLVNDDVRVFCFEPLPDNAKWIHQSIKRNDYKNIEVVEACVSDGNSEVTLHIGRSSGGSSIMGGSPDSPTMTCPAVTMDAFIQDRMLSRVDLVKIDVEGAELRVLAGANDTIDRFRPIMLIDLHKTVIGKKGVQWLFEFAAKHSYSVLDEKQAVKATAEKITNAIVFAPNERLSDIGFAEPERRSLLGWATDRLKVRKAAKR